MRRHTAGVLLDHITKPLTPLEVARVKLIPQRGDWRDLPNIEDGTCFKKLVYSYKNHHYKNNVYGKDRGVCPCMEKEGAACLESCNQKGTLIPWFMAHSGARNNEYAGMYGRVSKNEVFPTVTTDPRPDGKQGRVLHPDQDRVCTVREFARAQGFPDHYRFCGTLAEKYRQVRASLMDAHHQNDNLWNSFINSWNLVTGGQRRTASSCKSNWAFYQGSSYLIPFWFSNNREVTYSLATAS